MEGDKSAKEVVLTRPPVCVIVSFPGASWKLPGLEPGMYPIQVWKSDWHVDQKQRFPKLRVIRRQLPFCPAFAGTANFAQGQNLGKVFADVSIADGTSGQTCCVALSRVSTREDIYLLRAFPRAMFSRTSKAVPELLLQYLRGEPIEWEEVTEQLLGQEKETRAASWKPQLECAKCGLKPAVDFDVSELEKGRGRECRACRKKQMEGFCQKCFEPLEPGAGGPTCSKCAGRCEVCAALVPSGCVGLRCRGCMRKVQCECCRGWLEASRRVHQLCERCRDAMECGRCSRMKRKADFSECERKTPSSLRMKQRRRCNACLAEETEVYAEMRRKSWKK